MPAINSIFGKTSAAWRSYVAAGRWRTVKAANRALGNFRPTSRAPLVVAGGAFDALSLIAKTFMRAGVRTAETAGRHPVLATTAGLGVMGAYGAFRGMQGVIAGTVPVSQAGVAAPPTRGPGYNMWANRGGTTRGNLGATGDLTLALRKSRHG